MVIKIETTTITAIIIAIIYLLQFIYCTKYTPYYICYTIMRALINQCLSANSHKKGLNHITEFI